MWKKLRILNLSKSWTLGSKRKRTRMRKSTELPKWWILCVWWNLTTKLIVYKKVFRATKVGPVRSWTLKWRNQRLVQLVYLTFLQYRPQHRQPGSYQRHCHRLQCLRLQIFSFFVCGTWRQELGFFFGGVNIDSRWHWAFSWRWGRSLCFFLSLRVRKLGFFHQ